MDIEDHMSASLKLVMRLSQATGTAPIIFKRSTKTVRTSRTMFTFSCLIVLLFDLGFLYNVMWFLIYESNAANFTKYIRENTSIVFNIILSTILLNYGVFCGLRRMNYLLKFLSQVQKFVIEPHLTQYSNRITAYKLICFFIWPWILMLVESRKFVGNVVIISAFMNLQNICIRLMLLQFVFTVYHMNSVLEMINKGLREIILQLDTNDENNVGKLNLIPHRGDLRIPITSINRAIDLIGNVNSDYSVFWLPYYKLCLVWDKMVVYVALDTLHIAPNIRLLIKAFTSTCEIMKNLNSFGELEILTQILIAALSLWRILNSFIDLFGDEDYTITDYVTIFTQSNWCIYYILQLTLPIEPYYRSKIQVDQAHVLVGHMVTSITSYDDPAWIELNVIYTYLCYNKHSYCVGSICKLDRALVLKIVSGLITFLVTWIDV